VIARVFRELNLIEQSGSGVPRIFSQIAAQGFPEPFIRELGLRVRFVFPLAKSIHIQEPTQSGAQSGAQWRAVLMALANTPLSASELTTVLGLEIKTGAFKRTVKELLEQGLLNTPSRESPTAGCRSTG